MFYKLSIWWKVIIGSGNGLKPSGLHGITWANVGQDNSITRPWQVKSQYYYWIASLPAPNKYIHTCIYFVKKHTSVNKGLNAYRHWLVHDTMNFSVLTLSCDIINKMSLILFYQQFEFKMLSLILFHQPFESDVKLHILPSGNTIWGQRTGSTLAQVMAWCHQASRHYLNQCRLIINEVHWHSPEGNIKRCTHIQTFKWVGKLHI